MRARLVIAIAILVGQAVSVAYAHFGPAPEGQAWLHKTLNGCSAEPVGCRRYVAWAPNDYLVQYRLLATVGHRRLSVEDARRRYHLPTGNDKEKSYWEDPPQRLIDTIARFERTHADAGARVLLTYTING